MNSFNHSTEQPLDRYTFTEVLSEQFVAMTGHGVYVYLNPIDVDQLFNSYQTTTTPIRVFIRQCVKNTLA